MVLQAKGSEIAEVAVEAALSPQPGQAHIALSEWRRNWRSGLGSMIGIGLGTAIVHSFFSIFIAPLQQSFGWSRAEIAFAYSASFGTAILAPFIGRLIDQVGIRKPLLVGTMVVALCYIGFSAMQGSLLLFYALFATMSWFGVVTTGLSYSKVVSHAFPRSRGLSLALVRSGMAVSSALLPVILFTVISSVGWRGGYLFMALLVGCISLPAVYFWIERGRGHEAAPPMPKGQARPWLSLLKDRRMLTMCLAAALGYAPSIAIQTQLQPLLTDRGLEPQLAAMLVGGLGAASFCGALLTGTLIDRFWAPLIAAFFAAGSACGALLLLPDSSTTPMLMLGVLLIGLGQGAEIDLVAYLVARYFGVRSFSSIYGLVTFTLAVSVACWAMLIGYVFEAFGGYQVAMAIAAAGFLLSGILYLGLGRYPAQPD